MSDEDREREKERRRFEVSMITTTLDHEKRISALEKGSISVAVREEVTQRIATQSGDAHRAEAPVTQRPLSDLPGRWKALAAAIVLVVGGFFAGVTTLVIKIIEALR